MRHFKQIFTDDYEIQKIQSNAAEMFDEISTTAFLNGNIIEATILTTDTYLNHGLSRNYTGYVVIERFSAGDVYTSATINKIPSKQIILKANSDTKVKLYVF